MADERSKAIELRTFSDLKSSLARSIHAAGIEGGDRSDRSDADWIDLVRRCPGCGGFPARRLLKFRAGVSANHHHVQVIAEAQKMGGMAAFVDAEHALDPGYAKKLGVDVTTCWSRS